MQQTKCVSKKKILKKFGSYKKRYISLYTEIKTINNMKLKIYCEEISGISTKIEVEVPNNLDSILAGAERLLFNNNNFLFVRFYYMNSYYQVQNKNLKIINLNN